MIKVTAIRFSVFPSSCPIAIPNHSARVFPLRYFVLFFIVLFADMWQSRCQVRERTGNNFKSLWEMIL